MPALRSQTLLDELGNRGFSGAGKAGKPQHTGLLPFQSGARDSIDRKPLDADIRCPAQCEIDGSRTDRFEAVAIDKNERSGLAVVREGIEGDRLHQRKIAEPDFVEAQVWCRQLLEVFDLQLV